jgi:type I restriction enzyme S subunit
MRGWPTKALGELLEIQNGFAFKSELFNEAGRGIPVVRIRDLARGFSETFYEGDHDPAFEIADGDFLIGMDGEFRCYRWRGGKALLNQRVCRLQTFSRELEPSYVLYGINSHLQEIEDKTAFATVKHISAKQIASIKMSVPPLAEQERLVRLLDEANELRKLRAQADRRTTDIIPALFHEMFGDAEKNSKRWPTKTVREVCDLVRGSSPRPRSDSRYYGGPIPRLMIEDITRDGWLVTPRVDSLTELGATMSRPVKAGTIVMAVSGNIGLCAQLTVDACIHDGFVAFNDLQTDLFLPLFFGKAMSHMRRTHQRNQAGAIFQNITTTDVKAMKIPVPPLSLQKEFARLVTEIRVLEAEQAASRRGLEDLFQSLLHRAFHGEL